MVVYNLYYGIYILMELYNFVSIVYALLSNNFVCFIGILLFNSVYVLCMVYHSTIYKKQTKKSK